MSDLLPARSLVFIRACAVMLRDNHPAYLVLILSMPHGLQADSARCRPEPGNLKKGETQPPRSRCRRNVGWSLFETSRRGALSPGGSAPKPSLRAMHCAGRRVR